MYFTIAAGKGGVNFKDFTQVGCSSYTRITHHLFVIMLLLLIWICTLTRI